VLQRTSVVVGTPSDVRNGRDKGRVNGRVGRGPTFAAMFQSNPTSTFQRNHLLEAAVTAEFDLRYAPLWSTMQWSTMQVVDDAAVHDEDLS
jgi:hypothetical protein